MSWYRLWVIRFAISPSQNTGIEIPISARIISNGSKMLPFSTAAASPMMIDTTTQMIAAPNTSESVTGVAATISGMTRSPWFEYDVRSRVMNSFFIRIRYCTGSGRSRPYWCLISLIVPGEGLRPASWRAGSAPWRVEEDEEHQTVIATTTNSAPSVRRMTNVSTPALPLDPQLGAGIEGVTDAVAEHVQRRAR